MNQGMHVKYFELVSIEQQMSELKKIIKPKFELVDHILEPLKDTGLVFMKNLLEDIFIQSILQKAMLMKLCKHVHSWA